MRIVHLTSAHPWHDPRIFGKMCRSLAASGCEVHLVVPRADAAAVETRDGVTIHPVPPPRNRADRMARVVPRVLRYARRVAADLYHFHDPEFLRCAVGFQRRTGRPVVYDAHEDLRVQTLYKDWIPSVARGAASRLAGWIEDRRASRLAAVVAATPSIAARFAARVPCAVVQNFPILGEFPAGSACPGSKPPGLFAYVGGIDRVRGVFEMLAALPLARPEARLVLAGRFSSPALAEQCRGLAGWQQVIDAGYLDRAGVRDALRAACAGLVVLHPLRNYVAAYPIKMFEYMAAGLPVIASDFPLWRSIIEGAGCGLLVDPLDPRAVAAAMRRIMDYPAEARAMGQRGRQAVLEKYNWDHEVKKLFALYESLIDRTRQRAQAA